MWISLFALLAYVLYLFYTYRNRFNEVYVLFQESPSSES